MGNSAGAAQQVIVSPKGGGAQKGVGEKFAPDLQTGAGNFTVPLALPPGRNGFQPQLNLVYSTGNGDGRFGFGWRLSIPGVSRKSWRGVPQFSGYFPLRFGADWDSNIRRYEQAPSFNLEDPEVKLFDLDGDGVTDAIRSGTRLESFFSDPQGGWHNTNRGRKRGRSE